MGCGGSSEAERAAEREWRRKVDEKARQEKQRLEDWRQEQVQQRQAQRVEDRATVAATPGWLVPIDAHQPARTGGPEPTKCFVRGKGDTMVESEFSGHVEKSEGYRSKYGDKSCWEAEKVFEATCTTKTISSFRGWVEYEFEMEQAEERALVCIHYETEDLRELNLYLNGSLLCEVYAAKRTIQENMWVCGAPKAYWDSFPIAVHAGTNVLRLETQPVPEFVTEQWISSHEKADASSARYDRQSLDSPDIYNLCVFSQRVKPVTLNLSNGQFGPDVQSALRVHTDFKFWEHLTDHVKEDAKDPEVARNALIGQRAAKRREEEEAYSKLMKQIAQDAQDDRRGFHQRW